MNALDIARAQLAEACRAVEKATKEDGWDSHAAAVARERRAAFQAEFDRLTAKTETLALAALGERIWGKEWAAGMARLTGINVRTCQRVLETSRSQEGDPRARGIFNAFGEALPGVVTEYHSWLTRVAADSSESQ